MASWNYKEGHNSASSWQCPTASTRFSPMVGHQISHGESPLNLNNPLGSEPPVNYGQSSSKEKHFQKGIQSFFFGKTWCRNTATTAFIASSWHSCCRVKSTNLSLLYIAQRRSRGDGSGTKEHRFTCKLPEEAFTFTNQSFRMTTYQWYLWKALNRTVCCFLEVPAGDVPAIREQPLFQKLQIRPVVEPLSPGSKTTAASK